MVDIPRNILFKSGRLYFQNWVCPMAGACKDSGKKEKKKEKGKTELKIYREIAGK